MKTKFSNAEKVSDKFLKSRYDDLRARVHVFTWKSFLEDLDAICTSNDDNYEVLKKIIRLERAFDNYLKSKEFFFDVIRKEFSSSEYEPYKEPYNIDTILLERHNIHFDPIDFLQYCIEKLIKGKKYWNEHVTAEEKEKFFSYLCVKQLKGMIWTEVFEHIFKILDDEDIKEVERIIHNHFEEIFKRILQNSEEKLIEETNGYLTKRIHFPKRLSSDTLCYITEINMAIYWEDFDYSPDDERANNFRTFVNERLEKNMEYFARKEEFWYLLINFREFCASVEQVSEKQIEEAMKNLDATETAIHRRKVSQEELEGVLKSLIWSNLDFTGLDLSNVEIGERLVVNCDFENTGITVNLSGFNANTSVHYVNGKKIDKFNLINSCFKGCKVRNATSQFLNVFTFSSDTFDKEIALMCDPKLEYAGEDIREKYYRKILPTEGELEVLFLCGVDAVRRYGDLITHSKYTWLLYFDRVSKMPYIEDRIREITS